MAYKIGFLHFVTKENYNSERNKTEINSEERRIFDANISFVDEGPTIYTRGKEYKCELSFEEVKDWINSQNFTTLEDIPIAATELPIIAGTANVGTSNKYAREDHIHPEQINITGNAQTATTLQTERDIILNGAISGNGTFDGSKDVNINTTINNIDASKITSGVLDIERLPKGALERMVIVANQAARFLLTTSDVQEGDTVQQTDTGVMYFVVDSANLDNESGYRIYTAGAATSVPWSGITGKPEFLQLGETSTTAYAGDKGKLTNDITKSLGTQIVTNGITTSSDTDTVTLSYGKVTRSSTSETFVSNSGNAKLSSATQSKAGVMSAADKKELDTMQFSSINLIDESESIIVTTPADNQVYSQNINIHDLVSSGDKYAISIGSITNLVGAPEEYTINIYNKAITKRLSNTIYLSKDNLTGIFEILPDTEAQEAVLRIFPGPSTQNAGNSVQYNQIMFVKGSRPELSWMPSLNDLQRPDELWTRTVIDLSDWDKDTWYPITFQIDPSRINYQSMIKISSPIQGTAGFSNRPDKRYNCLCSWKVYGNGYGWIAEDNTQGYRIIESYSQLGSDDPIVSNIGQITKNSIEYVYVRGSAKYIVRTTNITDIAAHKTTFTAPNNDTLSPITIDKVKEIKMDINGTLSYSYKFNLGTVDLNTIKGDGNSGIAVQDQIVDATTARHYPIQSAGALFYGQSANYMPVQLYGAYLSNRWFVRAPASSTTFTDWKELTTNDQTFIYRGSINLGDNDLTQIPANVSGSYRDEAVTSYTGSVFVFYSQSSNGSLAFRMPAGKKNRPKLLQAVDASSSKWTDYGEIATDVSFTRSLTSGTKIGTLKYNGTTVDLFAPASSGGTADKLKVTSIDTLDLNTLTTSYVGQYFYGWNDNNATNNPLGAGAALGLQVIQTGLTYVMHLYAKDGHLYTRNYNGTSWGSLINILDSSNSSLSGNTVKINGQSATFCKNDDSRLTYYGVCSTAAGTAAKTVSATGFTLVTGAKVVVKFTYTNTAASPTLNVNNTGAKAIYYRGAVISAARLIANRILEFVYDGSHYEVIEGTTYDLVGANGTFGLIKNGSSVTSTSGYTACPIINGVPYYESTSSITLASITDLNSSWDALLTAAPSIYVTRHPTISEVTSKQNLVIKLNSGTTEGTNLFTYNATAAKTINITAASIGAAASSHTHTSAQISDATHLKTGSKIAKRTADGDIEFNKVFAVNGFFQSSYTSSDERLKTFKEDVIVDFDKLKQIPKKYFVWNNTNQYDLGTSAQEIQKIYPELVSTDNNGYLAVDYAKLSTIALAAVDQLYEKINILEQKIKDIYESK